MNKSELITLLESVASIAMQTSAGIKAIKNENDFDAYYYAWRIKQIQQEIDEICFEIHNPLDFNL